MLNAEKDDFNEQKRLKMAEKMKALFGGIFLGLNF